MKIIIILICSIYTYSYAQIDFENPPWDLSCDTANTQLHMNICSAKSVVIADSIMNNLLETILAHYDLRIKQLGDKSKYSDDEASKYLESVEIMKQYIVSSQAVFEDYKKITLEYVSENYKGASMKPMAINMYSISLLSDRIRILEGLIDEFIER